MVRRSARQFGGSRPLLHSNRRKIDLCRGKWHVNVFEEDATGDTANAVRSFNEIVTGLTAMLATERVGERERMRKLTSADEKTSAINIPITFYRHDFFTAREVVGCELIISVCKKYRDCTRRIKERQLHMNCAAGGILGRYSAREPRMKTELRVETNRARMAAFEMKEKFCGGYGGCGDEKFAHDVHRKIRGGQKLEVRLRK
jgi:hypothetical protein